MSSDVRVSVSSAEDHVHPSRVTAVRAAALPEPELLRVTAMLRLVADPTRARLLYALLEVGELCVCDLAAATGAQEATVSQALRLLRAAGVVSGRRQGRMVFYRVDDEHVRSLLVLSREHVQHGPPGRETLHGATSGRGR